MGTVPLILCYLSHSNIIHRRIHNIHISLIWYKYQFIISYYMA